MIKTTDKLGDACCVQCLFSSADNDDEILQCHRYPPTPLTGGAKFPVVNDDDFCGEFREET